MSATDLMLLGLLRKQPRSAYELNAYADRIRISKWVRIRASTTYANVKKLAAAGYLSARTIRDGGMPPKTVYALTPAGEERFGRLMDHFATHPGSLAFDFTAMVANLDQVDADTATRLLDTLRTGLAAAAAELAADATALNDIPDGGQAVMRLYKMLLTILAEWVDELRVAKQKGGRS
jgi:DNA-binding PadR family transcriptional regulator